MTSRKLIDVEEVLLVNLMVGYVVKCGDEVCKFVLSVACPNQKYIVNKRPPYKGLIWCIF